jgi:predicted alpha-1,2-mannosidase
MVRIIPEERKIVGYCRNNSGGVPENFHNYFVAVFDRDFELNHCWGDEWNLMKGATESEGEHVGAIVGFRTNRGEQVHVKVASSFISPEQAELNLQRELGSDSFEQTRKKARESWQQELGRIVVEGENQDHLKTFYSCLYRLLLFPRKFYEVDAGGKIVHYSPYNGKVLPGKMFTDNGFWDTFRAVFPFFNLMYPSLTADIMEGLANTYLESGWLPEWASPGHRDCMIGSNSAINVADAWLKGNIPDEKVADILFEAVLKNADVEEGRPVRSVGREGLDYYNKLGYVPYDVGINENAARTLEYAFADYAIARMAESRGEPALVERFDRQAQNYRHLFDPESGWMRGKNEDGSFQEPFNPLKWGDAFTEGNSLHYTWSVFHDIPGLMELMGGRKAFAAKLDEVFDMPPDYDDSYYGFTIHEIREMQIVNMGNYAHGNQPIQHMIYLYNHAGEPGKAQEKVREVLTRLYTPHPDGYCGDEDNGQTSAWYVFSALGFYPVTPVTDEYVIGSPLFRNATLHLEDGKRFTISAPGNGPKSPYISSGKLNGIPFEGHIITFGDIRKGGLLEFRMQEQKP